MEEELDPFEWTLALELRMTRDEMRQRVSQPEYISWRAYFQWRKAQLELAMKETK